MRVSRTARKPTAVAAPSGGNRESAPAPPPAPVPRHVAILGLGPSVHAYLHRARCLGARGKVADEVWAINALGDILQCDRVFHMDDVRIQEVRAAAAPDGNIAAMLAWIGRHPGPVYTSRPHGAYPCLVAFPLEEVINHLGYAYFNGTAAYAVAYAVHIGVEKISLFGCDFTYPNAHHAEQGRACLEFWLGQAAARGIRIGLPDSTTLMDENAGQALYGYDTLDVAIEVRDGHAHVAFTPKPTLPTAAEIEARYDHTRHPNSLVK